MACARHPAPAASARRAAAARSPGDTALTALRFGALFGAGVGGGHRVSFPRLRGPASFERWWVDGKEAADERPAPEAAPMSRSTMTGSTEMP